MKHSPQRKIVSGSNRFYGDKQPEKVASLLEDCEDDNILASVSEYVCEALNLNPKREHTKRFRRLRSVRIRNEIYTTDGTDPTAKIGKNIKNLSYWKRRNNGDSRYCCKYERDSERSDISDIYD